MGSHDLQVCYHAKVIPVDVPELGTVCEVKCQSATGDGWEHASRWRCGAPNRPGSSACFWREHGGMISEFTGRRCQPLACAQDDHPFHDAGWDEVQS